MELNSSSYIACRRCNRPINGSFFGNFNLQTSNCLHSTCYFKQRFSGRKLPFHFSIQRHTGTFFRDLEENNLFIKHCSKISTEIGYLALIDYTEIPRIQEFIIDRDKVALYPLVDFNHILKLNKRAQDWSEQVLYNAIMAKIEFNNAFWSYESDEIYNTNLKIWLHLNDHKDTIEFEQKIRLSKHKSEADLHIYLKKQLSNVKRFQQFVLNRMMFNPSGNFIKLLEIMPNLQDLFYQHCIDYAEMLFNYLWKNQSCYSHKFLKHRHLSNFPKKHAITFSFYQKYEELMSLSALFGILDNQQYTKYSNKKTVKAFIKNMKLKNLDYYKSLIDDSTKDEELKIEVKEEIYKLQYNLFNEFGPMETKCHSNSKTWLSDYIKRIKMSNRLSKDPCCICLEEKAHPLFFSNCPHSLCYKCVKLVTKERGLIDCPECRAISRSSFKRGNLKNKM